MRRMISQKQIEGLDNLNKFIDTSDGKTALFTLSTNDSDYWDKDQYNSTTGVYTNYLYFVSQELFDLGWHGETGEDLPTISVQGTITIPVEYGKTFEDFMEYISSHEAIIELEEIDESFIVDPYDNSINPTLNDLYWVGGPDNAYDVIYESSSVEIKANITKSHEIKADYIQADNMESHNISTQKLIASNEIKASNKIIGQQLQVGSPSNGGMTFGETGRKKILVDNQLGTFGINFTHMGNLFFSEQIHHPNQVVKIQFRAATASNSPVPVIIWTSDDTHITTSSSVSATNYYDTVTVTLDFTNSSAYYSKVIIMFGSRNQFDVIDYEQ